MCQNLIINSSIVFFSSIQDVILRSLRAYCTMQMGPTHLHGATSTARLDLHVVPTSPCRSKLMHVSVSLYFLNTRPCMPTLTCFTYIFEHTDKQVYYYFTKTKNLEIPCKIQAHKIKEITYRENRIALKPMHPLTIQRKGIIVRCRRRQIMCLPCIYYFTTTF